ncbi:alpha-glucosidase [Hanamia caeni]|uniref:Alpha-glucosidase n=1 Tax=Hanamia caeni TaxID=2294116 RepID=A0A3M9NEZ6_9BACT|nr:glycoside hydrolase family 97 protein [Hanamia caeni]RNI35793.1 alpha-glucosidase [Hanamia caeni]
MSFKKIKITMLISLVLIAVQGFSQKITLSSPDKNIKATFSYGSSIQSLVSYTLFIGRQQALKKGMIAFDMEALNSANFSLTEVKRKTISSSWQTVYGERKNIPDRYNEVSFQFKSSDQNSQLKIICRAYNEGFAFQYKIFQKNKTIVVDNELSQFKFRDNETAWASSFAQSPIIETKINDIKGVVERPLTVRLNEHLFVALGEAALVNFARMKFASGGNNNLITRLYGKVKGIDSLSSPWRYILAGKSPADLLQKNYLVLNLNEPNQISNTSWIQPGKVLRESTLTTDGAINCIDFAASHGIRYISFDAGWYGKEDSDTSDATRVSVDPARSKGPLDLKKVIAYGKKNNVGVILYVNRRALERQLDTLLPLYQSWGIKGLKFGFVQVGSQYWTNWLHEAVRKAAKYKMVVDIHDEYRPTGYSRTYPNLLTQEGIRGDEESPFTEHTITTLFTRCIAGAADNTNCYFTNRVDKMGSHVAQMAKAVCIYSPLQFLYWYDKPVPDSVKTGKEGEIQEVPELAWFNQLPTVWDETKVLEGDMEGFATIVRRSGDNWFLGSLNGTAPRKVNWNCNFLDKGKKYKAVIYTDDSTMNTTTKVKMRTMTIDDHSKISLNISARNGVAIHIFPL